MHLMKFLCSFSRDGAMSQSAMELLRLETELDFWPSLLNSHRHSVTPSNCHHPATPPSPTTSTSSSTATSPTSNNASSATPAMTNHFHHHHHGHHSHHADEQSPKSNEKKSVAGYSRTPHSYCKLAKGPGYEDQSIISLTIYRRR